MGNLINYNQVKNEFQERGYELLSTEYINQKVKLKYICNTHSDRGIQEISYNHFHYRNHGCRFCANEKISTCRLKNIDENEYIKLADSKGFIYVSYYRRDGNIFIKYICRKHEKYGIQEMTPATMKNIKYGCKHCVGRKLSPEDFLNKVKEINPDIELLEPYINCNIKIKCRCKIHGIVSYKKSDVLLQGNGCYKCWFDKNRTYTFKSTEEFKNKMLEINPKIEIIGDYKDYNESILCRCNKCKNEWLTTPKKLLFIKSQCPTCKMYSGEFKIANLLDKWGFKYVTQHRLSDCKDQLTLPFDFYIPLYNILIEYDGILHFKPQIIRNKMTEQTAKNVYDKIVSHDDIKNNYCKIKKIPLIRISCFDDDDGNLEYILFDELIKYGVIEEINIA